MNDSPNLCVMAAQIKTGFALPACTCPLLSHTVLGSSGPILEPQFPPL